MNTRKIRGFTLIEMLLVIAIIAIILSLSLVVLRKNSENARANKASLEMQNVLQAAMTYVTNTGQWPVALTCNVENAPDPAFISYLPNSDYQSNYGANFCWSRDGNTARFWVALPLPGSEYKTAQQIAAQLPNAYALQDVNTQTPRTNLCDGTESICYVRSEVSQNSAGEGGSGIVAAGYCNPRNAQGNVNTASVQGSAPSVQCSYDQAASLATLEATYQITFPCANGQGNVVITPNFLYMGTNGHVGNTYPLAVYYLQPDMNSQSCATNGGMTTCRIKIIAKSDLKTPQGGTSILGNNQLNGGINGYVGASYVGYCSPTS